MALSPPTEPVFASPADTASTSENVEVLVEAPTLETDKSADPTAPSEGETSTLSKNQRKKLARQKRFEETRPAWKAAKKEKAKARRARRRQEKAVATVVVAPIDTTTATASVGEKRKLPGDDDAEVEGVKRVKTKGETPVVKVVEDITLIMDCGFDDLMTEKVQIPRREEAEVEMLTFFGYRR